MPGGNEPIEALPDRFTRGKLENMRRSLVKKNDALRFVYGDDRVHRRLNYSAKLNLTFEYRLLRKLTLAYISDDPRKISFAVTDELAERYLKRYLFSAFVPTRKLEPFPVYMFSIGSHVI